MLELLARLVFIIATLIVIALVVYDTCTRDP